MGRHEGEAMGRHEGEAMGRQTDLVLNALLPKHKNAHSSTSQLWLTILMSIMSDQASCSKNLYH